MSVVVEAVQSQEAAGAVFLFNQAQSFWLSHSDLLPYDYGLVYQSDSETDADKRQTLQFDAGGRQVGQYVWQITETHANGRTIRRLTTTRQQTTGQKFDLDQQGILTGTTELAEPDCADLQAQVQQIVDTDLFRETVRNLRDNRVSVQRDLSDYLIKEPYRHNKINNPSSGLTNREIRERQVDGIGFSALNLYIPHPNR